MTTFDNGSPDAYEWRAEPKPNPFDVRSVPNTEPDEDHLVRGYN